MKFSEFLNNINFVTSNILSSYALPAAVGGGETQVFRDPLRRSPFTIKDIRSSPN
jgi:hypothetical protein